MATPVHGTSPEDRGRRWFLDFYEQWSGIIRPCNWVDFTFVDFNCEWSKYKGSVEASLAILGLRVTATYVYDSAANRGATRQAEELLNAYKGQTHES